MSQEKIERHHRLISRRKFLGALIGGGGVVLTGQGLDALSLETVRQGTGPGPSAFRQLNDVIPLSPKDGDVWTYQASNKQWINEPAQLTVLDHKLLIDSLDTTPNFLSPKLLVGSGITKTIENPSANEDIKLALDTGFSDGRYVLKTGDTMTGSLKNVQAAGALALETKETGDTVDRFALDVDGNWSFGPGGASSFDIVFNRLSPGMAQFRGLAGAGQMGIGTLGTESGAAARFFSENAGRAVIINASKTHLNDIERTRFTVPNLFGSVGASSTVIDVEFFVPSGKVLKVWFVSWNGSGAPANTTLLLITPPGGNFSVDTAVSGSQGDPSANVPIFTSSAGPGTVIVERTNSSAKIAFMFSGIWVFSIE
jgi:hypothetical protein